MTTPAEVLAQAEAMVQAAQREYNWAVRAAKKAFADAQVKLERDLEEASRKLRATVDETVQP